MKVSNQMLYLLGAGLLIFQACTKEVSFKQNEIEQRLVVNGFIEPDSVITVRISGTVAILEDRAPLIDDAIVKLTIDGSFTEELQYLGDGRYSSVSKTAPGSEYAIEVSAPGYPDVKAIDTLPGAVPILEGSKERGNTYDEYGDPHVDIEFVFQDQSGTDFYEFMFLPHHNYTKDDTVYYIGFQWPLYIADPVLKKDSELEYEPFTYVFSDELFEGLKYRMENKFFSMATSGSFVRPVVPEADLRKSFIVLRHVSSAYYQYRKSWIRHSKNQQLGNIFDDPLYVITVGAPKPMYSNIEGGYGIFAAYNTSYYSLER